jgi:hypothetical protein
MKSLLTSLLLLITVSIALAQRSKIQHFGLYAGYNVNSINHPALDHLTDLWNNSHEPNMTIRSYKDFLRLKGLSGGLIAYHGKLFADIGFDVRKTTNLARFKDVVGQFQSQTLSMNAFHFGIGINTNNKNDIVTISPGASFSIGKIEIKEGIYRTLDDVSIPLEQKKPTATIDNTKSMSVFNSFISIFVNVTIGKLGTRMPKLILQPYLTIPLNKMDLTQAYYPPSVKAYDPALKAHLTYWGAKIAIAL